MMMMMLQNNDDNEQEKVKSKIEKKMGNDPVDSNLIIIINTDNIFHAIMGK